MQHLQLQKHEDLALQMQLLYIVPSCEYHTNVVIFEMGLQQSRYFRCMSGKDSLKNSINRLSATFFFRLTKSTLVLLNYRLSQKFKLSGNGEFNHLTIILTLPLTCGPKLPLNKWGPNKWEFNILNEK